MPVAREIGKSLPRLPEQFRELLALLIGFLPIKPMFVHAVSLAIRPAAASAVKAASGGVAGVWRHAEDGAGGLKRVQIEPHFSITGACSAEWVPIKLKTDAAFLFAMIHVLLLEKPRVPPGGINDPRRRPVRPRASIGFRVGITVLSCCRFRSQLGVCALSCAPALSEMEMRDASKRHHDREGGDGQR